MQRFHPPPSLPDGLSDYIDQALVSVSHRFGGILALSPGGPVHLLGQPPCLDRAFDGAEGVLGAVLRKARFWEAHAARPLNERHRRIVSRLLEELEGKLTTFRWAALAKCSHDTALREIQGLIDRGILTPDPAGGRSTSYSLVA